MEKREQVTWRKSTQIIHFDPYGKYIKFYVQCYSIPPVAVSGESPRAQKNADLDDLRKHGRSPLSYA